MTDEEMQAGALALAIHPRPRPPDPDTLPPIRPRTITSSCAICWREATRMAGGTSLCQAHYQDHTNLINHGTMDPIRTLRDRLRARRHEQRMGG